MRTVADVFDCLRAQRMQRRNSKARERKVHGSANEITHPLLAKIRPRRFASRAAIAEPVMTRITTAAAYHADTSSVRKTTCKERRIKAKSIMSNSTAPD